MRRALLILPALLLAHGCGGDSEPEGPPPTQNTGVVSNCDPIVPAAIDGAVSVGSESELRDALVTGGPIRLTRDISASAAFEVNVDTVIDGGGNSIDAQGQTHLFTASGVSLTIQNVTLQNAINTLGDEAAPGERSGAAVRMLGGDDLAGTGALRVIGARFINNQIPSSGLGVSGGAIYVENVPYTTIYDTEFTDNQGASGGAIGGSGSGISVVNSVFSGNLTSGTGGGASGEGHGGAIAATDLGRNGTTRSLRICGSRFNDNGATNTGGAVYVVTAARSTTRVQIEESSFEGNQTQSLSEGQGGALFIFDDDLFAPADAGLPTQASVERASFVGNTSFNRGGGVAFASTDGELSMTNVTFYDNRTTQADGMGGGLSVSQGSAFLTNATFSQNFAEFHAGGIYASDMAILTLRNSLFHNNLASREGGMAPFHLNRQANWDGGGNLQFLADDLVVDESSDSLVTPNATRADPLLSEPEDNGGFALTMALGAGSPAIDSGVENGAPAIDQRGEGRIGLPDVGAYELIEE